MERASFIFGLDGFAANVPAAERRQKRPFNLYPFDLDRHSNDRKVQFILTLRAPKGEWILLGITHKPSSEEQTDACFLFPLFFFCRSVKLRRRRKNTGAVMQTVKNFQEAKNKKICKEPEPIKVADNNCAND